MATRDEAEIANRFEDVSLGESGVEKRTVVKPSKTSTVDQMKAALAAFGASIKGKKETLYKRWITEYRRAQPAELNEKNKALVSVETVDLQPKQKYNYFLCFDVEATCSPGVDFKYPNEIIEFPVVLLHWVPAVEGSVEPERRRLQTKATFQRYVKPTWQPVLSEFCTTLTGITQATVDEAKPFPAMLVEFELWLAEQGLLNGDSLRADAMWVTDGRWDLSDFIQKQLFITPLDRAPRSAYPLYLRSPILNIKHGVRDVLDDLAKPSHGPLHTRRRRRGREQPPRGLTIKDQLTKLGLGDFEGRQHSGIDDATNIGRIVAALADMDVVLEPNYTLPAISSKAAFDWMGADGKVVYPPPVAFLAASAPLEPPTTKADEPKGAEKQFSMDDDAFSASPWADVPSSPKPDDETRSARTSLEASKLANMSLADRGDGYEQSGIEQESKTPWGSSPKKGSSSGVKGIMAAFDASDDEAEDKLAPTFPAFAVVKPAEDDFDDFDDFDEPAEGDGAFGGAEMAAGDGFGDFGDFEEGDEEVTALEEIQVPAASPDVLQSLQLDPFPSSSSLAQQISAILEPMFPSASAPLTDEPLRQVGGLGQIMYQDSSREAYAQLTTPPMLKPLDWTRSRTRREHLISLGVPVNLDEVDSHRLTALPPLTITTSAYKPPASQSTVERSYTTAEKGKGRALELLSAETERNELARQKETYGLGKRPDFDRSKADELLDIAEDRLSIMPRAVLERIQKDLVQTSAQASELLAHLLQLKDAQTNDSVTYNGLISELISNAQKVKAASTAASGGGVFRKSSIRKSTGPGSGANTPRRTASPW